MKRPLSVSQRTPIARRAAATLMAVWLATPAVHACPVCFRFEESRTTDGMQAAIGVLMAVTVVVVAAFGRFVVGFVRRSREAGQ